MKVKLWVQPAVPRPPREEVEVEVEFPILRRNGGMDDGELYAKIISPTEGLEIYERFDGSFDVRVDEGLQGLDTLDHHLGRGKHACTEAEWNEVYARAVAYIGRFAPPAS